MKKSLIKKTKTLISLLLIIAIILPSYALSPNADTSAFITKTEFDAALSKFNNRLSEFEAGINSKIDNQVTSYLDRNGIWSGVNHMYCWKKTSWIYKYETNSYSDILSFQNLKDMTNATATNPQTKGNFKISVPLITDFINQSAKIKKSGLVFIRHKFESHNNEFYCMSSGGTGKPGDNFKTHWHCEIRLGTSSTWNTYDNNKPMIVRELNNVTVADCQAAKRSSNIPYSSTWEQMLGGNTSLMYGQDWTAQDCMFVNKNEYFTIRIYAVASGNPDSCYVGGGATSYQQGTWTIMSCDVY